MVLVSVEVGDLAAAARALSHSVGDPLTRLVGDAVDGVLAGGGMAGDDPAGGQWAATYDRVAPAAIGAAQDVINACYRVSAMLAATARNYAHAEAASTVPGHRVDAAVSAAVSSLPDDTRIGLPSVVPSAAGGGSGGPPGWHYVAHHLGGYVWPNGHQDRLRAAAAAWRRSAAALESHATPAAFVDIGPFVDRLPEADDIGTVCRALGDHLEAVARAHRGLARACSQLATHIDHAHSRIEHELVELLEWTAGIQAVGALASIFTFGTAEGPTQAGEAARIAKTVAAVSAILRNFVAAVNAALAEIGPLAAAVSDVRAAVAWLKDLRIVEVEVSAVPGLRAYSIARVERTGGEVAATTELAAGEEAAVSDLANDAVRAAHPHAWARQETLEDHFVRHGPDFGASSADEYAGKAAAFYDSRGAGGIEIKIDESDGTVRIYDPASNTFGSYTEDGLTRSFYKPKAGRAYWERQPGVLQ